MSHRYWELSHITMVNWYLFAALDIETRGAVALTGPNGSGKSSILDAIQTVLTAAHGRHLELNARVQTERGPRRTIRDYVLGAIDDGDEGLTHVRSQGARSYIMLGFRRTDGSREATLGLCVSARLDVPHEEVEARFMVDGRILTAKDVSDVGEDDDGTWSEAHPWQKVAAHVRADPALTLNTESGPEVFVRSLCRLISPDHGLVDPLKFIRNLKNSAAFKPVSSTTDFVRGFILDGQKLNLSSLRDSIGRFRDIRAKIDEFKRRIAEADELSDKVDKVKARQRTLLNHRLTLAQGRLHLAATTLVAANRDRDNTATALASIAAELPALRSAEESRAARLDEIIRIAANDDTARAAENADRDALVAGERVARLSAQLAPLARLIGDIEQAAKIAVGLDKKTASAMAKFAMGDFGIAASKAAKLPGSALDRSIQDLAVRADQEETRAAAELAEVVERITSLEANLDRIRSGKTSLGPSTRTLMTALQKENIAATPLAELVAGVDETWRQTIEAILGDACEALIVDPRQYEDAQRIYRASNVRGALLVNTTKGGGARRIKSDGLASVVICDDPYGRDFLDFRLGQVAMVKSHTDLAKADSAATADLMYASGRTVRKLYPPRHPRLGLSADGGGLDRSEADLAQAQLDEREKRLTLENLRSARRSLVSVADRIRDIDTAQAEAWLADLAEAEGAQVRHQLDAKRLRGLGVDDIQQRLEDSKRLAAEARERRENADRERARLDERLTERNERVAKCALVEQQARAKAHALVADHGAAWSADERDDAAWWLNAAVPDAPSVTGATMDSAVEGQDGRDRPKSQSLEAHLDYLEFNLVDYQAKRVANDRNNVVMAIGDYLNRHAIIRPDFMAPTEDGEDDDRFEQAASWVVAEAVMLRQQALVEYEDQAAIAYQDAIAHFKGDFVGKMRGAFEEMHLRLRELNRQLAKRDFHGLTYRFERKTNLSHRDMIDLIERAADPAFEIGLGDDGGTDPVSRALRRLEELAMDPQADLSEIEDPRRYFEFDISMGKDGVERTTMSKRMGTGSGGQVQVPYYVAICAALAATYYPERSGEDGGMALAIFDEAFNRMDTAVISEVVSFMRDVGLQPFIAAPDKERATFIQFVDTMIGISRSGKAVLVDVQYVKPLVHETFKAENPALVGFESFQTRRPKKVGKAA